MGAEPRRSAGRSLQEPQQLREALRPPCRAAGEDPSGRRDLGQPVRQYGQPRRPCRDHGGGDLAPDAAATSTASSAPSAPAARWPATAMGLKRHSGRIKIGIADPMGAALYELLHERRAEIRGLLDHRGHRPGPHHRKSRRLRAGFRLSDPRRRSAEDRLRPRPGRGPLPRRLVRHQHRRRHAHGPRDGPRPHHRDHPLRLRQPLPVEAVQPGLPEGKGPAGARMDRAARRISTSPTRRWP